jgi:hypothetical protein
VYTTFQAAPLCLHVVEFKHYHFGSRDFETVVALYHLCLHAFCCIELEQSIIIGMLPCLPFCVLHRGISPLQQRPTHPHWHYLSEVSLLEFPSGPDTLHPMDTDNEVANPPRHLITSNVRSISHGCSNHDTLSGISLNARCFRGMKSCHYHSVLINIHAVVVPELVSPQSHSGAA